MTITITLFDKEGHIRNGQNDYDKVPTVMTKTEEDFAYLSTQELVYEEGDYFKIETDKENSFVVVRLDESLTETVVFIKDKQWLYEIPLNEKRVKARSDVAFKGHKHYISVRYAKDFEINQYMNLSRNSHDLNEESGAYPHAYANVETRNDATFFACNAIDGVYANNSHGAYPYQTWGINQQLDAEVTIDFGRKVAVDMMDVTLRCDFPHDSYWTQATVEFSDGSEEIIHLEKIHTPQNFTFTKRVVEWVKLKDLIQDTDESPFPALAQLDIYGTNCL
ncbi:hypothetical protein SAMN05421767_12211 [Granulicatella balaenopterae]|uniref:Uncharacterized protein n=1 Tax=Granulicatella balaenopterae TaxID=137733 RepID=A0A1H9LWD3_9LACT|nr:hypothetical protein [Granulicatella balaenopterae]SER15782.1 hypothetical protein SAMN05421767_12211 [Granulicatella balaenopterae]